MNFMFSLLLILSSLCLVLATIAMFLDEAPETVQYGQLSAITLSLYAIAYKD